MIRFAVAGQIRARDTHRVAIPQVRQEQHVHD